MYPADTDSVSHTFYTRAHTPRLDLSTWAAIGSADATGALDETRWVEKQVALPPSNSSSNLELARDCASLSRDVRQLVIGVHDKRGVMGTTDDPQAAKVRIIQVCEARISPPLYVDATVVEAPPGWTPAPPGTPASPGSAPPT